MKHQTYEARAEASTNELKKQLLNLVASKKSNLAVSVDLTTKSELLRTVDLVGPYVCLIKTHIDIVTDFDDDLVTQLQKLSAKHNFLIFEDRKFADIGNTVKLQYSSGIYRISSWAHIVNCHIIPGEGIIKGLSEVGKPLSRGLLLLAEMSSSGTLATGEYTKLNVALAEKYSDFVVGFISLGHLASDQEDFICMTPGISLDAQGDTLGQSYRTPDHTIREKGSDIAIVGRGIYGSGSESDDKIREQAQRYQKACWEAYEARLQ